MVLNSLKKYFQIIKPHNMWLFLSMIIPLDLNYWKEIKFDNIQKNKVQNIKSSLSIEVNNSSSILIYNFKTPKKFKKILLEGNLVGNLNFKNNQGKDSFDDFTLKIGFIVLGNKKLTGLKKLFAPDWIINLHKIFPKTFGLSHLELFVGVIDLHLLKTSRLHPLSNFFHENFVFDLSKEGRFKLESSVNKEFESIGLWLSADGDNSKSKFNIKIHSLELK